MPRVDVVRTSPITRSARVMQLESMFDVAPAPESTVRWSMDVPVDERPWKIGMIVGPSGAGKSTIARELFGRELATTLEWPADRSLVDGFRAGLPIKEITGWLSSVGFSSPPSWLRPYHVLSTGEQFRATVARLLCESEELVVVDEFTSVVDRQVARAASAAISSAVRRSDRRFVAVGCHYDVIEWLQPDWVLEPHESLFQWREVQRRPEVRVEVVPVHRSAWDLFKRHHYLSTEIAKFARCFVGTWEGVPVGFVACTIVPGQVTFWRGHRAVVLPDYQGLGIGHAMMEWIAWLYSADRPFLSTSSHPAIIAHMARSPNWNIIRKPSWERNEHTERTQAARGDRNRKGTRRFGRSMGRVTASARWVGESATREEFERAATAGRA